MLPRRFGGYAIRSISLLLKRLRGAYLGQEMSFQHILAVVQSDLQYICSLRRVLELKGFPSVAIARNSQEAILYLRGVGIYEDRTRHPLPSVVILDSLNVDGGDLEVLGWLRDNMPIQNIPVIFLCSQQHNHAHLTCALDPISFIVERDNFDDLADTLHNISAPDFLPTAA